MTRTARLKAFAKLNLGLRVLWKRPDGFHELRTVFQTISLADRLDVAYTPAAETTHSHRRRAPYRRQSGGKSGAADVIRVGDYCRNSLQSEEANPFRRGPGGRLDDAAAVLLALPVLAGKTLPPSRLFAIAAELGSDVPFFLHGGTALGIGRGEELYPLPDQPQRKGLLIAPDYSFVYGRSLSRSLRPIDIGFVTK